MAGKTNHFDTRVIHAGQAPEPVTGAVMPPIFLTSTFVQEAPGEHKGFDYARGKNPTRFALERCLADLENGSRAFSFASGLATEATILELLPAGSHIISTADLYGGTVRLFERVRKESANLSFSYVDLTDLDNFDDVLTGALQDNTKMIWVETPSNPMLQLVDLERIAAFAKKHNLISVADNTFATPFIQQPLDLGFDLVIHSVTKYLNGHSDIIGGAVVAGDKTELADRLQFLQNAVGGIQSPFDSFMVLRGIKTLGLRMERHCGNALKIAEWMAGHRDIFSRVIYPGLSDHPQHELARRQMNGRFGGIVTVELKGGLDAVKKLSRGVKIFTLAESLGGVESLMNHPARMTHGSVPQAMKDASGITDGLLRFSVGIENADDLIADLEQAF